MSCRRFSTFHIALLVALALPLAKAASVAADTPDSDIALCIYRISGTYGAFARWIYYASLLAAVIFRRAQWLTAGILASAMLYSSAAVVHACAILRVGGLNPEVLDADIIPITTITLSTSFLTFALVTSTTFHDSKAWPIITLWNLWIWLGTIVCCAASWILVRNPRVAHFSEIACYSNGTSTSTFLSSAIQLSIREYRFDCNYSCFGSHASTIRNVDEIVAVSAHDIFSKYAGALPGFCVAGILIAQPIVYYLSVISTFLFYHIPEYRNEFFSSMQIIAIPMSLIPGLAVIVLGEGAILRREKQLKTESFRAVGQWTSFVCVLLVVFVSLTDKYIFEPWRSRKEKENAEKAQRIRRLEERRKQSKHSYGCGMQTDIELGHRSSTSQSASRILTDHGQTSMAEGSRTIVDESTVSPLDNVYSRHSADISGPSS